MGDFTKLVVWNKSMDLVVIIYELSANLPKQEMFALSDQMKRAAVSIPSNIAEGQSRISDNEFRHFLMIARGSGAELETQLRLCVRLGYFKDKDIQSAYVLLQEIQKMLAGLAGRLKK